MTDFSKHFTFLKSERARYWAAALAFVVVGLLIYSNALGTPFVFDDVAFIVDNPYLHMRDVTLGGIKDILKGPIAYRPLTMFSFALNYYFGRHHVLGYHIVNVVIHVITGFLLFLFFKITLSLSSQKSPFIIAFFAALLWFVSPLRTQAVTFIFQRGHSMATMFYVLSFLLYVKGRLAQRAKSGRPSWWFMGCALSGLLAMLSKGIAFTLPFYIFLYEWYFFQELRGTWFRKNIKWIFLIIIPACIFGGVHFLVGTHKESALLYHLHRITVLEHLLTETRVVIYYLSLIFYPHPSRMIFDHGYRVSHSLIDPVTTLLSIGLIVGLVGAALALAKRERLVSFCILWYFGQLVIEAIFPFDLVWDYRTYIPAMFVHLLAVQLVWRMVKQKRVLAGVFCAMILISSVWTYQRNAVYRDPLTLWLDTAAKAPNNPRAHNNLADLLWREERLEESVWHLKEALRIHPDYADAHNNLGNALRIMGRNEEGVAHLREALRIDPGHADARLNLTNAFFEQENLRQKLIEDLQGDPQDAEAHYNMGNVMVNQRRFDEAAYHYNEALRINPDDLDARNNLAAILMEQGWLEEAREQFQQVLQRNPDYPNAQAGLKMTLERMGMQ